MIGDGSAAVKAGCCGPNPCGTCCTACIFCAPPRRLGRELRDARRKAAANEVRRIVRAKN